MFDPHTVSYDYSARNHSRAGCEQRKGRVGRTSPGEVFRLYTKEDFDNPGVFEPTPVPEVRRKSREQLYLKALVAGAPSLTNLKLLGDTGGGDFVDAERQRALRNLIARGAIDTEDSLTPLGVEMSRIETETIDAAHVLRQSDRFGCLLEVATFLAMATNPTPPFLDDELGELGYARWREGCLDDLVFYLRVFHQWYLKSKQGSEPKAAYSWAKREGLNARALEDINKSRDKLLRPLIMHTHTPITRRMLDLDRLDRTRLVIARSVPEWLYVRTDSERGLMFTAHSTDCPAESDVGVDKNSACVGDSTLEAFVCFARTKAGRMVLVQHVVRVEPKWLETIKSGGDLEVVLWLNEIAGQVPEALRDSARLIMDKPGRGDAKLPKPGDIHVLHIVRAASGSGNASGELFLVQLSSDAGLSTPYLALFSQDEGRFVPGQDIRAKAVGMETIGAGSKVKVLRYSVGALAETYKPGTELKGLRFLRIASSGNLVFEVEPGLEGLLPLSAMGGFRGTGLQVAMPRRISERGSYDVVAVKRSSIKTGPQLILALPKREVKAGKGSYWGAVKGFLEQGGRRTLAFIEITPGVTGALYWKKEGPGSLDRYEPGDDKWVRVLSIEAKGKETRIDLEPT
jgi:hypothetical protein